LSAKAPSEQSLFFVWTQDLLDKENVVDADGFTVHSGERYFGKPMSRSLARGDFELLR
jgi:hypothetical protein